MIVSYCTGSPKGADKVRFASLLALTRMAIIAVQSVLALGSRAVVLIALYKLKCKSVM